MPAIVNNISSLGNVKENRRGRFSLVEYRGEVEDVEGWELYDLTVAPTESLSEPQIWYRRASRERRVDVTYKMQRPLAFISGDYRVEVFVPDQHASVTKASFSVTKSLDAAGKPVETAVTIDMLHVSNEWVPLGEFGLALDKEGLVGRVRQSDDTDENLKTSQGKDREISFGPVRWVPLYQLADPIYAKLDDPERAELHYLVDPRLEPGLEAAWGTTTVLDLGDTRREWRVRFRRRSRIRQLEMRYSLPADAAKGPYRIEVFIPQVFHTRSAQAVYTVKTGVQAFDGQKRTAEQTIKVDQSKFPNQWAPLGEFDLEADPQPDPGEGSPVGQVTQFDDTADVPNVFVTFGPVRWVPRFKVEIRPSLQFDFPIGQQDQRHARIVKGEFGNFAGRPQWLENWVDATGFLTPYDLGIHTGADLNLKGLQDFGSPVFASGDGKVHFAGKAVGSWGFIIVIEHPLAWVRLQDGRKIQGKVYTRYGHVTNQPDLPIRVTQGEPVTRGQHIGFVGVPNVEGGDPHLHFDVCYTETLGTNPDHWPDWSPLREARKNQGSDPAGVRAAERRIQALVRQDYLDPLQFFIDNHEAG